MWQKSTTGNNISYAYNPVPYDIFFSLYIGVKNVEDGTNIIEQIVPYFTPEWTATLNLVNDPNFTKKYDTPIIIQNIACEDNYEAGNFTQRRALIWTINFVLKGYFFGPIHESGLIKQIYVNFEIPTTNTAAEGIRITPVSEQIYIQPGETANGQPTSNASLSIPPNEINVTDNWAYVAKLISKIDNPDE